ncbi:MAG: IS30 family transposase [Lachnospiraceae bacterium]|nr:IS30 family transposase [Lachnospiraceae bacterium]
MVREHLTLESRQLIEHMLNEKHSLSEIAAALMKNRSTIGREVKAHITIRRTGGRGFCYNNCVNRYTCTRTHICYPCKVSYKQILCRRCNLCNINCNKYEPAFCVRLQKPPYVCNGCGKSFDCSLEKHFYFASNADQDYHAVLSESRSGMSYTEEELQVMNQLISPLIQNGQSPHHVYVHNRDSIMVSERTIYRLIDKCLISARNIDLPRKVRFRPRKRKKLFKVDKNCRIGRDFEAFQQYTQQHPDIPIVQLDSVEGKKGGKVLLTVHFVKCEMMLAFLRDTNDAQSVIDIFNSLYEGLGSDDFRKIFTLLLADNGSEFSDPKAIEFTVSGEQRTRLFYCNPSAPFQKGSCERNHEFIRYCIPKGKDFSLYTQSDITLMMNHINSYSRESLGNKCPYEVFRFLYGDKLLNLLGCVTIPAPQIILKPSLFRKEVSE